MNATETLTDFLTANVPDDVAQIFADIARGSWDPRTGERGLWSLWNGMRGAL